MFALRRGLALVRGQDSSLKGLHEELEASAVPVTLAPCRACPSPCDEGHEAYPKFDIDMDSYMLGSVKPYSRQFVISTGQSDWDRDITHTHGSLAAYLSQVETRSTTKERRPSVVSLPRSPPLDSVLLLEKELGTVVSTAPPSNTIAGVFNSSDAKKVSILNGSHNTLCEDPELETVLIFPDYKIVTEVPRSLDGAQSLWKSSISQPFGLGSDTILEKSPLSSWVIPYSCVILLCSHKKRDKRCSIAAIKLEHAFTQSLESKGWGVDTQLEHPLDDPLEDFTGTEEEQEINVAKQLQDLRSTRKALIIRNSHIGGHRYAGNCIIYTPRGVGVWYGRVSTHEVESIVNNTIEEGMVLPQLLRGGINISRPGCSSLHDW